MKTKTPRLTDLPADSPLGRAIAKQLDIPRRWIFSLRARTVDGVTTGRCDFEDGGRISFRQTGDELVIKTLY